MRQAGRFHREPTVERGSKKSIQNNSPRVWVGQRNPCLTWKQNNPFKGLLCAAWFLASNPPHDIERCSVSRFTLHPSSSPSPGDTSTRTTSTHLIQAASRVLPWAGALRGKERVEGFPTSPSHITGGSSIQGSVPVLRSSPPAG